MSRKHDKSGLSAIEGTNKARQFPRISKELIESLEEQFPDKAPDLGMTYKETLFQAGRVDVVRFLKRIQRKQHEGKGNENVSVKP